MSTLIERFLAGDRRALARLLSEVENRSTQGRQAIEAAFPRTGRAHVVGITGSPGAGKSTLVNGLIREFRSRGRRVAVLAIDPSSSISGGAMLGDRIRMMENYADPDVFIRSMATRGQVGGLALGVEGATHLLDAFGFEVILIETVGVGQDEVDIADRADTTVLLEVPGLGDSIQTIKAGILEIADILVVNKADRPEANQLVRDLRNMLLLAEDGAPQPPIVRTVASEGTGLRQLADEIEQHRARLQASEQAEGRDRARLQREVRLLTLEQLQSWLEQQRDTTWFQERLNRLEQRLTSPNEVADELLQRFADRSTPVR